MLVEMVVGSIKCGRVAIFVPTNAVVVEFFLELVVFDLVAVGGEESGFPLFCSALLDLVLFILGSQLAVVLAVFFVADGVEHAVSVWLSSHVLDDIGLVLEFEVEGVKRLSVALAHVHQPFLCQDQG